jgi:hypothetical protein
MMFPDRLSVWDWKCKDGKPVAGPPKAKFDADGYATEEWELVGP